MATINVTVRAVHALQNSRRFAATVRAKNRSTGGQIIEDIPQSGGALGLETDTNYDIVADPRDGQFQAGSRSNIMIRPNTRTVNVRIAPMGEECRIWLEEIKRLIAKGDEKKAKQQIRLAKSVYAGLSDPPKETADIFETILKLGNGLP